MALPDDSALLVVDVQNCFLPGGSLPVQDGDLIVPRLNEYMRLFAERGLPVFASRDWHPAQTVHFQKWPEHCVQNTEGAMFAVDLDLPHGAVIISKGMDPNEDAYSAFQAVDEEGHAFPFLLQERGIQHLYVGGLALDYCVRCSALDAVHAGLRVTVLIDATRAVNAQIHDAEKAIEDLVREGVELATIETVRA